jgi:hypothetical protein
MTQSAERKLPILLSNHTGTLLRAEPGADSDSENEESHEEGKMIILGLRTPKRYGTGRLSVTTAKYENRISQMEEFDRRRGP